MAAGVGVGVGGGVGVGVGVGAGPAQPLPIIAIVRSIAIKQQKILLKLILLAIVILLSFWSQAKSNTASSVLLVNSHSRPVVGLEHKVTIKESAASTCGTP